MLYFSFLYILLLSSYEYVLLYSFLWLWLVGAEKEQYGERFCSVESLGVHWRHIYFDVYSYVVFDGIHVDVQFYVSCYIVFIWKDSQFPQGVKEKRYFLQIRPTCTYRIFNLIYYDTIENRTVAMGISDKACFCHLKILYCIDHGQFSFQRRLASQ